METIQPCKYFIYVYGVRGGQWELLFTRSFVTDRASGDATMNIVRSWVLQTSGAAEYYVTGTNSIYVYAWRDCGRGWEQV
jgi:hypothetical protein